MRYFATFLFGVSFLLAFSDFNKTDINLYNKNLKSSTYQNKLYLYKDINATSNLTNTDKKYRPNLENSIFDRIEIYGVIEFKFTKDI